MTYRPKRIPSIQDNIQVQTWIQQLLELSSSPNGCCSQSCIMVNPLKNNLIAHSMDESSHHHAVLNCIDLVAKREHETRQEGGPKG